MAKGLNAPRRLPAAAVLAALIGLFVPGLLRAQEAGALPLRPGETLPQPHQRGLNEIAAVPERPVACPACAFQVAVPEVDKLMRTAANPSGGIPWRMHAAVRDADLCPHPGPDKVSFQADIVVCPSCGYAAPEADYGRTLAPRARSWVVQTLRPNLLAAQRRMLGARAGEMTDADIAAFFNRQSEIPDQIRLEHARIRALARKDPALARAEITWLAAWAARREIAAAPRGEFLAKRAGNVQTALAADRRKDGGLAGDIEATRQLLRKDRSGKDRLNAADRLAARLLLAGMLLRQGLPSEAERELSNAQTFCRDRFQRPEQDPLWSATTTRASREQRRRELDVFRAEAEAEILVRLELLRQHQERLREASDLIREAVAAGELDNRCEQALFHAYLAGEFLRRTGNLPLASEWFKLVLGLAPPQSPLETAAGLQLARVKEQAGDQVNLLSAVGEDSDLLERLRRACRAR